VTPDEFERIQSNELELPKGWTVSELVPRPPGKNGLPGVNLIRNRSPGSPPQSGQRASGIHTVISDRPRLPQA
jgi:hypothetical protein